MSIDPETSKTLKSLIGHLFEHQPERKKLVGSVLGMDSPVLDQIDWQGAVDPFLHELFDKLCHFGEVERGKSALWKLLEGLRELRGVDIQAQIDALEPVLNHPRVPNRPTRDLPVVFLSAARSDLELAQKLAADLARAGHPCWIDTEEIQGGEAWINAVADALARATALVTVVTIATQRDEWVRLQYLHARQNGKPIIPLLAEDCPLPWYMGEQTALRLDTDYTAGLGQLLGLLPKPVAAQPCLGSGQRQAELAYLCRLQLGELVHTELYTPMAGIAKVSTRGQTPALLPSVVMRPEFQHLRRISTPAEEPRQASRSYDDIVAAFGEVRRAVLLGEPGAGKTTTLWKLARISLDLALADPSAPLPLLIRLGKWLDAGEPLPSFIQRELGELGAYLNRLLASRRAVLLLDGLNEVPSGERATKARAVKAFLSEHAPLSAYTSCRELDYTAELDLGLDSINIRPLDPPRILDFITGYLTATVAPNVTDPAQRIAAGRELGEDLFWRLAGGESVKQVWLVWQAAGADLALFWSAKEVPKSEPDVYSKTSGAQYQIWRQAVHGPRSLMRLAGNPYLLFMLTQVYLGIGDLPANRATLLENFVETLLLREGLAKRSEDGEFIKTAESEALFRALENLAWAMQSRQSTKEEAATALLRDAVAQWIEPRLLLPAAAASLLDVGEREVRFTHQLLQEYFTARGLRSRLEGDGLTAQSLWPRCWERTGWEEAAVLLAGMYASDCTKIIDWLAQAQPEVAAQCVRASGAKTPAATLQQLRRIWLPRLTDIEGDPEPEARAAVGRALGSLWLKGEPLDNRPGVGCRLDAQNRKIPDIDWVAVPTGEFIYQKDEKLTLPSFRIARYPITHGQFQAFIDDPEGYANPVWWQGLAERHEQPAEPHWDYANHPRETVDWYESVAFCRWLSERLAADIRLPTEQEWEKAARGTQGLEFPWGEFKSGFANIDETMGKVGPHNLAQTSAVGIYSQGHSPYGVLDMAGNVWEWCLNEYENPRRIGTKGKAYRVVRGGAWFNVRVVARCAFRFGLPPGYRLGYLGFRLVLRSSLLP